jgi:hypothetical protein
MNSIIEGGFLKGRKTYVTGALAILGTIGGYLTGDVDLVQAFSLIVPAIMGMTIRHGVG